MAVRSAVGRVERAELCRNAPGFARVAPRARGRKRAGLIYENQVLAHLREIYSAELVRSPWIRYWRTDARDPGLCQPDALFVDTERAAIVTFEVKLKHTPDSWHQLHQLYRPVLNKLFRAGEEGAPRWHFQAITVVKIFDPSQRYPGPVRFVHDIGDREAFAWPSKETGVYIYRP